MKKQSSKYYILLLLIAVFTAPGITAYVFYQHPQWLGSQKINKGTLLNPPVAMDTFAGKAKWRIVYWSPTLCDAVCVQQLDTIARMRLALGRKLYQVDQWLILGDKTSILSADLLSATKELDFQVAPLSNADETVQATLSSKAKVFLADPNNYLILSYEVPVNPNDVYKDLKLLLNATEKNG
jgi:cytochrome oxidase Cu insertion factor (SCO1/SenC/PrrC family)